MSILLTIVAKDSDSGLWRSMTASKLAALVNEENQKQLKSDLMTQLVLRLEPLGLDFTETAVQTKIGLLLEAVIAFAQMLSTQRALFEFQFPIADGGKLEKKEDSEFMSCLDTNDNEVAGTVRYVCTPALVKRGTGTGQNLHISSCLIKAKVSLFGLDD
jgi:hypothetical protein